MRALRSFFAGGNNFFPQRFVFVTNSSMMEQSMYRLRKSIGFVVPMGMLLGPGGCSGLNFGNTGVSTLNFPVEGPANSSSVQVDS